MSLYIADYFISLYICILVLNYQTDNCVIIENNYKNIKNFLNSINVLNFNYEEKELRKS